MRSEITRKGFFRALFGLGIGAAIAPAVTPKRFVERRAFSSSKIALYYRAPPEALAELKRGTCTINEARQSFGWKPIKEITSIIGPAYE